MLAGAGIPHHQIVGRLGGDESGEGFPVGELQRPRPVARLNGLTGIQDGHQHPIQGFASNHAEIGAHLLAFAPQAMASGTQACESTVASLGVAFQ